MSSRCFWVFCSLLLVGCASDKDSIANKTADSLYANGNYLMKAGEYVDAAAAFKEIETLFPYSSKSCEGQVLSAYCSFMASNYMDAIRELDIFLQYHPSHKLSSYAMYLRAMCIYMQVSSVGRDSRTAEDAKQAFTKLINKFPNSIYRNDSLRRIAILEDVIAAHEMMVGRFYQSRRNMLSAMGRYNLVVNRFTNTSHAQEAYFRIIECCMSQGLDSEALESYNVLSLRFPNSKWKAKASAIMEKKVGSYRK